MDFSVLNSRPIAIAIAGSNGAGKTTFFESHLSDSGLRFVNADIIAEELQVGPYDAADLAHAVRSALVSKRESFVFETVFSDPVGDKVRFLESAVEVGFEVVVIFIQVKDVETSIQRVSMRVAQGGHDIPDGKLRERFDRTRANLNLAIERLPHVFVFDNSDLARPYQFVARYESGTLLDQPGGDHLDTAT